MKHPELLLLPILMFADYFMTLLGAVQSRKKYEHHFKTEHYELNPVWQTDVARTKWLNPKHLIVVAVFSSLLIFVAESGVLDEPFVEAVIGCVLVLFGAVVGRHLSNLMIFGQMIRNPEQVSGQLTMSHALVLWISMYQYLVVCIPFAIITTLMPSPFMVGGLFGIAILLAIHLKWVRRYGMLAKKAAKPKVGGGEISYGEVSTRPAPDRGSGRSRTCW